MEREGGGGARRGGIGSRPIGAKVLKRFGLGFLERLKSIFDFGGDFQRARYVETGIRLTHSMQRDTKAERLVDYD